MNPNVRRRIEKLETGEDFVVQEIHCDVEDDWMECTDFVQHWPPRTPGIPPTLPPIPPETEPRPNPAFDGMPDFRQAVPS